MERKPQERRELTSEELIERLDEVEMAVVTCHHPSVYDAEEE